MRNPSNPSPPPAAWERAPLLIAMGLAVWLLWSHWWAQEAFPSTRLGILVIILADVGLLALAQRQRISASAVLVCSISLFAFPLWGWFTTRFSVSPPAGVTLLGTWLQGALIGLAGALFILTSDGGPEIRARMVVKTLALIAVILAVYGFYQEAFLRPAQIALLEHEWKPGDEQIVALLHNLREGRMRSTLGDPNHLGLVAAIGAICALCALIWSRKMVERVLWGVAAIVPAYAILQSGSRAGMLSLLVGLFALAVVIVAKRGKAWRRLIWIGVGVGIAGGIAIVALSLTSPPEWLRRLGNMATVRERVGYWGIAWKIFLANPLMGAGAQNYAIWYLSLRPDGLGTAQFPHNLPLQLLAETGITGLLLFALPLISLIRRQRRESDSVLPMGWALTAVLITFFINSLVGHSIFFREMWLDAMLVVGVLMGWLLQTSKRVEKNGFTLLAISGAIAILCISVILLQEINRTRAEMWEERSEIYAEQGDWPEALSALEHAMEIEPNYDLWPLRLGIQRMGLQQAGAQLPGGAERTRAMFDRAIDLNPLRASPHAALASFLQWQGNSAQALNEQEEAIRLHPAEPQHHRELASLLQILGNLDGAEMVARRAAELSPGDVFSQLSLGEILLVQGQWTEAEDCARRVVERDDFRPAGWYLLARAMAGRGDTEGALESINEALERDPGNPEMIGWRLRLLNR